MASSRLEKIGTIYTRITGLLKTGAMKWEDRPLWYDIYSTFPPKDEPKFDRPAPDIPVKSIFYSEDEIRALYHKNNKNIGINNMFTYESQTKTKKFIEIYKNLEATCSNSKDKLYESAIDVLNNLQESKEPNLASSFQEAQEEKQKINISKLFKEV